MSLFPARYSVGVHGYVLLYSVASRRSFEIVQVINEKILNLLGTDSVPTVLMGNKSDLVFERSVRIDLILSACV